MQKFLKGLLSVLLGLLFVIFSIQFFMFIYMDGVMPPMNDMAVQFNTVMATSGYMYVVKVVELVIGIMLLIPRTRKLALVLIAPIVANILLAEFLIIQPPVAQMIPAFLIGILTLIGIYQHRAAYMPIVRK